MNWAININLEKCNLVFGDSTQEWDSILKDFMEAYFNKNLFDLILILFICLNCLNFIPKRSRSGFRFDCSRYFSFGISSSLTYLMPLCPEHVTHSKHVFWGCWILDLRRWLLKKNESWLTLFLHLDYKYTSFH